MARAGLPWEDWHAEQQPQAIEDYAESYGAKAQGDATDANEEVLELVQPHMARMQAATVVQGQRSGSRGRGQPR